MDMASDGNGKQRHGECNFCDTEGYHRYLHKKYYSNGTRVVYSELILECFNITVVDNEKDKLICSECIRRLKEAYEFRESVFEAEIKLLDPLHHVEFGCKDGTKQLSSVIDIKPEVVKVEFEEDDFNWDGSTVDNFCVPEAQVDSDGEEYKYLPGELELLNRFPRADLVLPKKAPDSFSEWCRIMYDKMVTSKDIRPMLDDPYFMNGDCDKEYVTEKRALMTNVTTILECSNVTPFRSKTAQGFPCFFCRQALENREALIQHVKEEHHNPDLRKSFCLWKHGPESLVVNVDITDLKCNLCNKSLTNLNDLKKHLSDVHKKKIYTEVTDRIIPFKLASSYECQICGCVFETFGSVERHMNVHFRNYVCKDCGTGYVTKYRLKVHVKAVHVDGSYPCAVCKKVFSTYHKLRTHIQSVHKMMKRFKCPQCNERFTEYFSRQNHLVEVHGAKPIRYKCNVCDKSFDRRYSLSRHLKKDHLKEKNNECEYCSYKCFTITELRIHMIKHVGERTFECTVCKKAYARKKTLKEHMKIHTNDRRHACPVCGQAFIQKCSLKGHIKAHHHEFNLDNL